MNNSDIDNRFVNIENILFKLTEEKPSAFRKLWNWGKPYIVPFILGIVVGVMAVGLATRSSSLQPPVSSLERQAAIGGAAIPFSNESPLPSPSTSLPGDWRLEALDWRLEESSGSSLTNTSEESLPSNPQADAGQRPSTRFYRLPIRRMR